MQEGDGIDNLDVSGVGNMANIYEAEQERLLSADGITGEILGVLGGLDIQEIVAAGGIAERLREIIKEKRAELEKEIRETSGRFSLSDQGVANIVQDMEREMFGQYLDALDFVVANTHDEEEKS